MRRSAHVDADAEVVAYGDRFAEVVAANGAQGRCPPASTDVGIEASGRGSQNLVADPVRCLQNVSVPNILVRDLPDDVHRALQDRAEQRGQSLQQYLSSELARLAERPTPGELFERVGKRRGGKVGLAQAVADLDSERSAS